MRKLMILWILNIVCFANLAPAAKKTLQDNLVGKWRGFCSPNATANSGRICAYNFQKNGNGIYQCDFYKDIRCEDKDSKSTTAPFRFSVTSGTANSGKVTIDFSDREDVKQEKGRFYVTGAVLRVQIYEVFRMPEAKIKEDKLEAQGVVPFFEYTKAP